VERPIGIIDSGVGGLTVVKEALKILPNEKIVYLGDGLRYPYGPRSAEEVEKFTIEMAGALDALNIKMLVIACNTASAVALTSIREKFNFPVLGVIVPGVRAALNVSSSKNIAVLGTEGTINSGAYNTEFEHQFPGTKVFPLACPDFVKIVESGRYKSKEAELTVKKTLNKISKVEFDTAVLGCTHYPLLEKLIKRNLPDHVKIISSAVETILDVERILREKDIKNTTKSYSLPVFFTTGLLEPFQETISDWLKIDNADVRHIVLETQSRLPNLG